MPNPPTILFSPPTFYSLLPTLRLQELGLITKALRQRLRDDLRAYYKSHPTAMEPKPSRPALAIANRAQLMR